MANRAFIIPCRNDLPDGLVQFTDVAPNTSQANSSIGGAGQTGYIDHGHYRGATWIPPMNVELPGTLVADVIPTVTRGLPGWLMDHIQCDAGAADAIMTPKQARSIAARLVLRVVAGLSMTHTDITTVINSVGAMDGSAPGMIAWNPALPTTTGLRSNASGCNKPAAQLVEEVIRILSGEVYEIQALAIFGDGAGSYAGGTHPVVGSVTGTLASGFLTQPNAAVATQTWPASTNFVNMRTLYLSGSIRASAGEGNLSIFKRTPTATVPFGYNASIMPNGVTAATYGVANGVSANVRGSAHSNNFVMTLGAGTLANPSVITATAHPYITGDFIRLNGATIAAGTAHPDATNGTYTVTNIGANSFSCAINATAIIAAGATATLETTLLTNHIDIGATGQFRGIMVYDSEGNIL
jgi:hypothetical protein